MSERGGDILRAADLQRFCEYLYRQTGMVFGEVKRYYVERRLAERRAATGCKGFADYFARLRGDPQELEALINAFTVNETYFYREEHQLRCLSRSLLPEIVRTKGPGDRIRIWSVPCSTGEEPYSIAIWLLENWPMVDAYNVEIVGSDINTAVLDHAAAGFYGARALARLPKATADSYFGPEQRGVREIIDDLKESVTFTKVNLMDSAAMAREGRFEIVFCRNVLIYFDDASRSAAAANLFAALQPGGFICLGHTESMARISERFETRRFPDAVVYQRPEGRG
jgi:chemotaxis protein methyltransferase CheR